MTNAKGEALIVPQGALERGARGAEVDQLQQVLMALGYLSRTDYLGGPGIFGPRTEQALAALQSAQGLTRDGRYGPATRAALDRLVAGPRPGEPAPGQGGALSLPQLLALMPKLPEPRARVLLPPLNAAMVEGRITTGLRQAAFLAQLAHESGQLRYFEELSSGEAYEGRRDLGNVVKGDGPRYKGRGPIQLTGRANYHAAGLALNVDLEGNPSRAADPDAAFRVAVWFWSTRKLNDLADAGQFDAITYRINGGYNGKADRDQLYQRALRLFGLSDLMTTAAASAGL